jgi:POT family proton-dependent oligopeptide transporter
MSTTASASHAGFPGTPAVLQQRTFLGHPIGLYVLFFSEMWERFSYYGMRALLVLYMLNYFRWSQEDASKVYKWYTSLVYLTPLLGGYLADRFLGNKKAVIIGALLMAAGQFLLTVPNLSLFYGALCFMIVGNGFFKPNMSTQVGRLYPVGDPRRDGAYTIFYMGINLGAFFAPLSCGWLQENTEGSYHSGFAAAGIGMILGMLVYVLGGRWVIELEQEKPAARPAAENHEQPASGAANSEQAAEETPSVLPVLNRISPVLLAVLGIAVALGAPLLAPSSLGGHGWIGRDLVGWDTVIGLEIAAGCAMIAAWVSARVHRGMRDRVLTIYILGLFVVFFWAAFEQAGNAMNQWADKATNRYLTSAAPAPDLFPPVRQ